MTAQSNDSPDSSHSLDLAKWLTDRRVSEIECMVPDMSGIARGKILPTEKFLSSYRDGTLRLPETVFGQTVTTGMGGMGGGGRSGPPPDGSDAQKRLNPEIHWVKVELAPDE